MERILLTEDDPELGWWDHEAAAVEEARSWFFARLEDLVRDLQERPGA